VDAISDEAGTITARLSYDAWGKRRNPDGTDTATPTTSTRGFTRHEHDDEVGLINMNAREYDPVIGRFVSADPVLDSGVPSQALNRYTYAGNNPLSVVDPTGHGWKKWKKKLRKIFKAVVAVVATVFTAGVAAFAMASVMVATGVTSALAGLGAAGVFAANLTIGAIGGAIGGGVGGWTQTGNSDGFRAGARVGAISGGLGGVAGVDPSVGLQQAMNGKSGAFLGAAKYGAGQVLNQEIREEVNAFADKRGWSMTKFNGALFGVSLLGSSRFEPGTWNQTEGGIRGWLNRGSVGASLDAVDTVLAYQGLPTGTSARLLLSGITGPLTGHSLGALDVSNLAGIGALPSGSRVFALPFGKIGAGVEVTIGAGDPVNGFSLGKIFNPDAEVQDFGFGHACKLYTTNGGCGS
jgi:RHS repeat-associated protein